MSKSAFTPNIAVLSITTNNIPDLFRSDENTITEDKGFHTTTIIVVTQLASQPDYIIKK